MRQLLLLLATTLTLSLPCMGAESEMKEIQFTKALQTGKKTYRVKMNLRYVPNSPAMERAAARFLFKDSISSTLEGAVYVFLRSLGDKEIDPKLADDPDGNYQFQLAPQAGKAGKYQSYHASYLKSDITRGKKKEGDTVKKRSNQYDFAYDVRQQRILTLNDVMTPEGVATLQRETGAKNIQFHVADGSLFFYYKQNGKRIGQELWAIEDDNRVFFSDYYWKLTDIRLPKPGQEQMLADAEASGEERIKVFDVVESMPEFPGGQATFLRWLSYKIKYPAVAEENGIQGRVICSFVVERDGSITDVQVTRSIDPSLDREAVRVLSLMPRWRPGTQNEKPVRVKYTVPVTFKLQ